MKDIYDKIFNKIQTMGGTVMLIDLEKELNDSSAVVRKRILELQHSNVLEGSSVGTRKRVSIIGDISAFRTNVPEHKINMKEFLNGCKYDEEI